MYSRRGSSLQHEGLAVPQSGGTNKNRTMSHKIPAMLACTAICGLYILWFAQPSLLLLLTLEAMICESNRHNTKGQKESIPPRNEGEIPSFCPGRIALKYQELKLHSSHDDGQSSSPSAASAVSEYAAVAHTRVPQKPSDNNPGHRLPSTRH